MIEESILEDRELFKRLLLQPGVLEYFPMFDMREIDDAVRIWEIFARQKASLTAVKDGNRCGIAFLNLQGYKKLAHQCLLTIAVDEAFRNQGIGTELLRELCILAKEKFKLEMIHLEVYETNPAKRLYEREGFTEFGMHPEFIKEPTRYINKIFMQKTL